MYQATDNPTPWIELARQRNVCDEAYDWMLENGTSTLEQLIMDYINSQEDPLWGPWVAAYLLEETPDHLIDALLDRFVATEPQKAAMVIKHRHSSLIPFSQETIDRIAERLE